MIGQLRRLAELGIEVHTQVVLVPGLNDGEHLARTVADLASLYQEPVASLSVVPIGLTRYHCRLVPSLHPARVARPAGPGGAVAKGKPEEEGVHFRLPLRRVVPGGRAGGAARQRVR